jgi:hypothetical protein
MITDDHKKELGRLCINFQYLEVNICLLTWSLIGANQTVGQIITTNMSFSRICDILVGLSKYRFGEDASTTTTIVKLVKQASHIEQERNKFIHSYWITDDSSGSVGRFKFSLNRNKGFDESHPDVDVQQLREIADEAVQLSKKFTDLSKKLAQ